MSKRRKRGRPGNGIGPHQQVSAMGHATRTKSKREMRLREDRRARQKGWDA